MKKLYIQNLSSLKWFCLNLVGNGTFWGWKKREATLRTYYSIRKCQNAAEVKSKSNYNINLET